MVTFYYLEDYIASNKEKIIYHNESYIYSLK